MWGAAHIGAAQKSRREREPLCAAGLGWLAQPGGAHGRGLAHTPLPLIHTAPIALAEHPYSRHKVHAVAAPAYYSPRTTTYPPAQPRGLCMVEVPVLYVVSWMAGLGVAWWGLGIKVRQIRPVVAHYVASL